VRNLTHGRIRTESVTRDLGEDGSEIHTGDLHCVGADLTDLQELHWRLFGEADSGHADTVSQAASVAQSEYLGSGGRAGGVKAVGARHAGALIKRDEATLIVTECVLQYLDGEHVSQLVARLRESLPISAFVRCWDMSYMPYTSFLQQGVQQKVSCSSVRCAGRRHALVSDAGRLHAGQVLAGAMMSECAQECLFGCCKSPHTLVDICMTCVCALSPAFSLSHFPPCSMSVVQLRPNRSRRPVWASYDRFAREARQVRYYREGRVRIWSDLVQ
jgi:hypothetical protein